MTLNLSAPGIETQLKPRIVVVGVGGAGGNAVNNMIAANLEGVEFVEIGPGIFRMGSTYKAGGDTLGKLCASLGLPWGDQPKASVMMPNSTT